jgi:hypothetical protein
MCAIRLPLHALGTPWRATITFADKNFLVVEITKARLLCIGWRPLALDTLGVGNTYDRITSSQLFFIAIRIATFSVVAPDRFPASMLPPTLLRFLVLL